MTKAKEIQKAFLARVKSVLPANVSFVDELAELLNTSNDSAYRRLRAETFLSIDEIALICAHFKVPFETQTQTNSNNVSFNYFKLEGKEENFKHWLVTMRDNVKRISDSKDEGGFEAYPAMFQFGYQFEKQYLNEGNYQALFEFIPMITGVDQQLVIPSITILNGFRNNKHGWEVAIGPSISVASYKDLALINGKYYTEDELKKAGITTYDLNKTVDSRGQSEFTSALVIALGKTFKSGKMNIPLNIWASVPSNDGFRLGVSIGYNSKK